MSPIDQLQRLAAELGHDYDILVFRYLTERTLYRLGAAQPGTFVLKGGLLLGMLAYMPYRATEDADLTAFGHISDESLLALFEALKVENPCPEDGVSYSGRVRFKSISKGRNYQGVRVRIAAHLRHEKRLLSFDISHGSALEPPPTPWRFSTLVAGLPEPAEIRTYAAETIVAEKLHAFHLYPVAEVFPRIRDLYDLAFLAATTPFDGEALLASLQRTFRSRKATATEQEIFWPDLPTSLTQLDAFEQHQRDWEALTDGATYQPSLLEAQLLARHFAEPLLSAAYHERALPKKWRPGESWR